MQDMLNFNINFGIKNFSNSEKKFFMKKYEEKGNINEP
jgi:hypothetical protein